MTDVSPRRLRRYVWLLAVLVPTFMLVFYAHLSPHYDALPNLPALPKVHLQFDPEPAPEAAYLPDCICGMTARGRKLCDVYGEHALRNSRLVEGSGARIRNLLARLNDGMDLTIGVLGGSGKCTPSLNIPSDEGLGDTTDGAALADRSLGLPRRAPQPGAS